MNKLNGRTIIHISSEYQKHGLCFICVGPVLQNKWLKGSLSRFSWHKIREVLGLIYLARFKFNQFWLYGFRYKVIFCVNVMEVKGHLVFFRT